MACPVCGSTETRVDKGILGIDTTRCAGCNKILAVDEARFN